MHFLNTQTASQSSLRVRLIALCLMGFASTGLTDTIKSSTTKPSTTACASDTSGLTLPPGFCATVFADYIGHARHLVVSAEGVVYINTWSGGYYPLNDEVHSGGFIVALKDTRGTGVADIIQRFGDSIATGGAGGTGIGLYQDGLFVEANDKIVRYPLKAGALLPVDPPQTVVSGLPLTGDHPMHPFAINAAGQLFVDVATESNSCQQQSRLLESPGIKPCTELETRGGIWLYNANRFDQVFSPSARYATGIRNGEGFALDSATQNLYVTQHGRDQLHSNWPTHYSLEQEATLPAEELLLLKAGHDYGWPVCYYDPHRHSLVLAPEYGGNGKIIGECRDKTPPVAAFPAHWGPNGAAFYDKAQFPKHYHRGVFIAFHGSWNRAPYSQRGYNVVFQQLSSKKAPARCEIFADGFAGAVASPDKAAHRPSGIAVGPDGSLFVSDDVAGRIYRIVYQGHGNAPFDESKTVACPPADAPAGPIVPMRAHSLHHELNTQDLDPAHLPVPEGATQAMVVLGEQVYHGQVGGAACTGCHGADAAGSNLGPSLITGNWLWSDDTFAGIAATIRMGVAHPKHYRAAMPAMGGAQLTADQVSAVASYLWAINQPVENKPTAP